jgi:hypothetical protein
MKCFIFLIIIITIASPSFTQEPWEFGGEYMKPFGKGFKSNIAAGRYEKFKNKTSFSFGLSYHFSPGNVYGGFKGFGVFAGFRNYFGNSTTGNYPFGGLRLLLSFENFEGKTNLNSVFITPIAEAGYHFVFAKHIFTTPSIGWGYQKKLTKEFNSRNDDEGGRIIPGLAAGYRF